MRVLENPMIRPDGPLLDPSPEALSFHARLPGYAPTPLIALPHLAEKRGISNVLVKYDAARFGLPAFKMLGGSWAAYRSLIALLGYEPEWQTIAELREALAPLGPLTLATATDGNHGRAVAKMARWLGYDSRIFLPTPSVDARIEAIRSEGATVEVVDGDYEAAVAKAATLASSNCLIVSDTSWEGYTDPPRWVMEGYSTIFSELVGQIAHQGLPQPTMVLVPMGVGALGAAMVTAFRQQDPPPTMVGVEPEGAACVLASVAAAQIVNVPGPHTSIMVGLNCGLPSREAFPVLEAGLDWLIGIEDHWAEDAMIELSQEGIVAGETGAAALAGLDALVHWADVREIRHRVGLDPNAVVLVIITEGATDPVGYERVVGKRHELVST